MLPPTPLPLHSRPSSLPFPAPLSSPSPSHAPAGPRFLPAPQIQAANPVSRALFNTAYRYKQAAMQRGDLSGGRLAPLWDRLVFSKVRARVGGGWVPAGGLLGRVTSGKACNAWFPACRLDSPTPGCLAAGEVRLLSSGASPISPEVFDFLRICFSATGGEEGGGVLIHWLVACRLLSPVRTTCIRIRTAHTNRAATLTGPPHPSLSRCFWFLAVQFWRGMA